jgi:hypothetical protein
VPLLFALESKRGRRGAPISVKSLGFFKVTCAGGGTVAVSAARSPKAA